MGILTQGESSHSNRKNLSPQRRDQTGTGYILSILPCSITIPVMVFFPRRLRLKLFPPAIPVPWRLSLVLLLFFQAGACKNPQKAPSFRLEFLNEQILPKNLRFQGQPVGGLSALTFDESTGEFLALSDDKSRHRFYKFQISPPPSAPGRNRRPLFQMILRGQVFLREKDSQGLNRNMDPEGMDLKNQSLFVTSEGQQIFPPPEAPQVFVFSKKGVLKRIWATPPVFWNREKLSSFGARENKGFEALTLTEKHLWTATEKALRQDPDRLLRLSGFDREKGRLLYQYPYFLDPKAGLSEMTAMTDRTFLTLERAYDKQTGKNRVRLFMVHCRKVTDLRAFPSLKGVLKVSWAAAGSAKKSGRPPEAFFEETPAPAGSGFAEVSPPGEKPNKGGFKTLKPLNRSGIKGSGKTGRLLPCDKNPLFDFARLPAGITADNLEGMALGPKIAAGGRLLVFVSDNNFSPSQKTQFLFFRTSSP